MGGLFPIHIKSEDSELECGSKLSILGLQVAYAMKYAIAKVNQDDNILPNITLRATIFDTCRSQTIAASRTREFIKMTIVRKSRAQLAGVVGAAISDVSAKVASILQVFEIPQISHGSTSVTLSERDIYSYFLRTVPPDSFQAKAMVDICLRYGWTYVLTVNSEGIYGARGIEAFHALARDSGICTDHIVSVRRLSKREDYVDVVRRLVEKRGGTGVSVVVLFCTTGHSYGITRVAQNIKEAATFIWIASDAWDTTKLDLRNAGALIVKLGSSGIPQDFKDYFKALTPAHAQWKDDVYLKKLWRQLFNCEPTNITANNLTKCTGKESLRDKPFGFAPAQTTINAVYAFAHALNDLKKELCPNRTGICPAMATFKRSRLLDYLKNVSFLDSANDTMEFNKNGEVNARYDIVNFQENSQNNYVTVGIWRGGHGDAEGGLTISDVKWHGGNATAPSSYCSYECPFGHVKKSRHGYNFHCCWTCHACEKLNVIVNNTCLAGPLGYVPNANRTKWLKRKVLYLRWSDRPAAIIIAISVLSIFLTLLTLLVFCIFPNNRALKASGRELCCIILTGILLCFATPFFYIAKPSDVICGARTLSTSLALATCYAALFMKINRVYRVFASAKRSIKRPPLVRPKPQILVTGALISIQVMLTALWLVARPARATETYLSEEEKLILECKVNPVHFLVSMSYVIVLMVLCTVYAFKTRKFPKNFNESKYIGFTLYATCTVYVVFFAFFLNMDDKWTVDLLIAGLSVLLGLITLLGLFAQKIFIVIFLKEVQVMDSVGVTQTGLSSTNERAHKSEQRREKSEEVQNKKDMGKRVTMRARRSESF